jgi:MFS family permease
MAASTGSASAANGARDAKSVSFIGDKVPATMSASHAPGRDRMWVAVHTLGVSQITAWGTSFYCLGILAAPIAAETSWSRGFVYFGFTVALLVMGVVSTPIGKLIDTHGARRVMCTGYVIVALALAGLGLTHGEAAWLAIWAILGIGMRCCLYDAAFAALVQVTPTRGRLAISYLTLYGAFASSVFWTIGHYLNAWMGWRLTLMVFAGIVLAICLPLTWIGLARKEDASNDTSSAAAPVVVNEGVAIAGSARTVGVMLFALVMSLNGFVFGVVSLQLVQMLEAAGLAAATAVWVASLKGFAQFGGRVMEITYGRKLRAITVGRIAIGVLPLSIVMLLMSQGNFAVLIAFTLLMGAAQGVITIVRGAVPLALFGAQGYGAVLGIIATPVLIVNAASPTLFALIVDRWGWHTAQLALLACAVASCVMMEFMSRWHVRQTSQH